MQPSAAVARRADALYALPAQFPANHRRHFGAEQFQDRINFLVGQRTDAELNHEAIMIENFVLIHDLVDDLLRAADKLAPRAACKMFRTVRTSLSVASPRSRPILSIWYLKAGKAVSMACWEVSAMNPWEFMLSCGLVVPVSAAAWRCSSANS